MMFRRKVAAVSYLNTVPFIYGLEHAAGLHADLMLSPPSRCAELYADGTADVALIPVGALPEIPPYHIITPYCIGASGPVRTVTLMSNSPREGVRRIWLDSHSRTSALLVKILAAGLWGIDPRWEHLEDYTVVDNPAQGDAFLLIGDKVFDYESRFTYITDLSVEWMRMTSLPFVFAVWVARPGTDPEFLSRLETALGQGVGHISEAIAYYGHSGKQYAFDYLTNNIDYLFDEQKHRALELVWELGQKFVPKINPG